MTFQCHSIHSTCDVRPWAIVLLQPNAQHSIISRFRNRQDAEDQVRSLRRFLPSQSFEVIFDPPEWQGGEDS